MSNCLWVGAVVNEHPGLTDGLLCTAANNGIGVVLISFISKLLCICLWVEAVNEHPKLPFCPVSAKLFF